ncbi:MAG: hypothetical protein V1750_03425 [Acidobacteriota bacterium]
MEIKGAGGTPGGFAAFFGGLAMVAVGGYLLLNQVTVHSGWWSWFSGNAFGLTLVPLLVGIGFLFFDGRSKPGWVLTTLGALIIVAGIITNLRIYFRPTSLFNTLLMLGLMAAGLGLIARSLRPAPPSAAPPGPAA